MIKVTHGIALLLLTLPLMGMRCATTSWEVAGKCKTGDGCEVSGKIEGTFSNELRSQDRSLIERMMLTSETIDAASFQIDVSQSTVTVPANGQVTLQLVDDSTGAIQASSIFPWTKNGLKIVLSDPDAVNNWALASGGTATSMLYDLHRFTTTEQSGWNTLSTTVIYDGDAKVSATTTWRGQVCPLDIRKANKAKGNPGIRYCQ